MKVITIHDPSNVYYPLSRADFRKSLLYHGTRSYLASEIDQKGWQKDETPYDRCDIKFLVDMITSKRQHRMDLLFQIQNQEPYVLVKSIGWEIWKKRGTMPIFFSGSYWHACSYALNVAGELIPALDQLLELLISEFHSYLTNEELARCKNLKSKYGIYKQNSGFPVVYAIKSPDDYTSWHKVGDKSAYNPTLSFAVQPPISIDKILFKINFPKGIIPYLPYMGIENCPLPWKREEFLDYIRHRHSDPQFKRLASKLL